MRYCIDNKCFVGPPLDLSMYKNDDELSNLFSAMSIGGGKDAQVEVDGGSDDVGVEGGEEHPVNWDDSISRLDF